MKGTDEKILTWRFDCRTLAFGSSLSRGKPCNFMSGTHVENSHPQMRRASRKLGNPEEFAVAAE